MKKDIDLLNKIYLSTYCASKSLSTILPGITNNSMRRAVITQINEYDKINSQSKSMISDLGEKTKNTFFPSASATLEAKMSLYVNSAPSRIAEEIIKGSNSRSVKLEKELNNSKSCTPSVYNLGRNLIKAEKNGTESIKTFL